MAHGHVLPTLVLIYASIDILASLIRPESQEDVSRSDYTAWVEKYLLRAGSLPCTALEIYAARCALLHTYGAESRLSREGHARQIVYARGAYTGPVELETNKGEVSVVHVGDLFGAFHRGTTGFLAELEADVVLAERAYRRACSLFAVRGPTGPQSV